MHLLLGTVLVFSPQVSLVLPGESFEFLILMKLLMKLGLRPTKEALTHPQSSFDLFMDLFLVGD